MKKRVGATSVSAWVAHALAWAAGALLVLAPVYSSGATLIEVNGLHVMWLLLVPVLLTGIALWATRRPGDWRARRKAILWGAAGLLLGLCALAILSIGVFYLPAAFALVLAAVTHSGRTVA